MWLSKLCYWIFGCRGGLKDFVWNISRRKIDICSKLRITFIWYRTKLLDVSNHSRAQVESPATSLSHSWRKEILCEKDVFVQDCTVGVALIPINKERFRVWCFTQPLLYSLWTILPVLIGCSIWWPKSIKVASGFVCEKSFAIIRFAWRDLIEHLENCAFIASLQRENDIICYSW